MKTTFSSGEATNRIERMVAVGVALSLTGLLAGCVVTPAEGNDLASPPAASERDPFEDQEQPTERGDTAAQPSLLLPPATAAARGDALVDGTADGLVAKPIDGQKAGLGEPCGWYQPGGSVECMPGLVCWLDDPSLPDLGGTCVIMGTGEQA